MKTFNNRWSWWWCVCACAWQNRHTSLRDKSSVRFCSAKTRRITNAVKEWKRKYTPSKTMHIRFLLDRHDGHHRFYFFFSFFPLYWSLLFIFSCVLLFFYLFKWTQTCELVFSLFIFLLSSSIFFLSELWTIFLVCKWIFCTTAYINATILYESTLWACTMEHDPCYLNEEVTATHEWMEK